MAHVQFVCQNCQVTLKGRAAVAGKKVKCPRCQKVTAIPAAAPMAPPLAFDAARAKSLFLAASDLADPADRAAYLDRECGGNAELRNRVEALLRANDAAPLPPMDGGDATRTNPPPGLADHLLAQARGSAPDHDGPHCARQRSQ